MRKTHSLLLTALLTPLPPSLLHSASVQKLGGSSSASSFKKSPSVKMLGSVKREVSRTRKNPQALDEHRYAGRAFRRHMSKVPTSLRPLKKKYEVRVCGGEERSDVLKALPTFPFVTSLLANSVSVINFFRSSQLLCSVVRGTEMPSFLNKLTALVPDSKRSKMVIKLSCGSFSTLTEPAKNRNGVCEFYSLLSLEVRVCESRSDKLRRRNIPSSLSLCSCIYLFAYV